MIKDLTAENFDQILDNHELIVIDFWASWCQPCLAFAKVFAAVAGQCTDALFVKVNVEEETSLAEDFHVRSVPLLMILRQRVAVFAEVGMVDHDALVDLVKQAKHLDMMAVKQALIEDE